MNSQPNSKKHIDWKDNKIKWDEIIKKEARGFEKGDDLGEVQEIGQEFVVTERGRISKHKFYLPKQLVAGYDGETLWFNISEEDAEDNFKKDRPPKVGEYSRYKSASLTQQPSPASPSTEGSTFNDDTSFDKEQYIPLIEKRTINNSNSSKNISISNSGIEDWDSIIKKGVRTQDMNSIGIVTAVNNDTIIITTDGAKEEYNIPKDEVQSFNGAEVILNLEVNRLDHFKVKVPR